MRNENTVKTHPTTFEPKNTVLSFVRSVYPLNPCGSKVTASAAAIRYYG